MFCCRFYILKAMGQNLSESRSCASTRIVIRCASQKIRAILCRLIRIRNAKKSEPPDRMVRLFYSCIAVCRNELRAAAKDDYCAEAQEQG